MTGARPWRVFVFDIGPSFSFASEERAHERARQLIEAEHYGKVSVYNAHGHTFERTLCDGTPERQRLNLEADATSFGWEPIDDATAAAR